VLFFESGEGWAICGLHAEFGVGVELAAVGSDGVDCAGVVGEEGAGGVLDVGVVFGFVFFPEVA